MTITRSDPGFSASTDTGLLRRVKENDQAAWSCLVKLYAPLVYHWEAQSKLPPADRADVFQEVFRAVATHIDGFRRAHAGDTFRGWLRRITESKIADHYRRARKAPVAEGGSSAQQAFLELPSAADSDDGDAAVSPEVAELYRQVLSLVRERFETNTWTAFWRTAIDGVSATEVAQELDMTPAAVRQAKSRVLRRLKDEYGPLWE